MANRLAFQTQLASIMEVLANAAVAEICKLVDDDYAVINLQMSQCQRENKALKRKLHLLELRMARGYAERRIRENSLNRSSRVHVNAALSEKYSANAADVFQNQGELYRRQLNEQVWREGDSSGADVVIDPVIKGDVNGPGGSSQTGPTAVLVKAETGDGNHAQQQLFIREDGVTEAVCEAAEADYGAPPADKADAQHSRTRHQQALEVSGSDTVLKCEPQFVSAEGASQEPVGGEGEFGVSGECAPLEELFVQGGDRVDAQRPSCSYMNQHKPEIIEVESAEEGDALSVWDANVAPARHKTLQRYTDRPERSDHFNAPVPGLSRLPADFPAVASTSSDAWQQNKVVAPPQPRAGAYRTPRNDKVAKEKLFACKFCGKAFNRPKKVEIHQRIHTGEKPFRCNTCGKLFAEAGNLKKHQKVHTGERPYSCSQCGRSFAWIRNLKTHQLKYHPDFFMAEELMSIGAVKN